MPSLQRRGLITPKSQSGLGLHIIRFICNPAEMRFRGNTATLE